ncbi:hypothetical protein ACWDSJ_25490 [Nocardia sp. NPDC003482]
MGAWQVFALTMLVVAASTVVVLTVRPRPGLHGRTVAEISDRILAESTTPHAAPDHPLALPEAHRTMQQHLDCTVAACERKAAAYRVLVAAGRLHPR